MRKVEVEDCIKPLTTYDSIAGTAAIHFVNIIPPRQGRGKQINKFKESNNINRYLVTSCFRKRVIVYKKNE